MLCYMKIKKRYSVGLTEGHRNPSQPHEDKRKQLWLGWNGALLTLLGSVEEVGLELNEGQWAGSSPAQEAGGETALDGQGSRERDPGKPCTPSQDPARLHYKQRGTIWSSRRQEGESESPWSLGPGSPILALAQACPPACSKGSKFRRNVDPSRGQEKVLQSSWVPAHTPGSKPEGCENSMVRQQRKDRCDGGVEKPVSLLSPVWGSPLTFLHPTSSL